MDTTNTIPLVNPAGDIEPVPSGADIQGLISSGYRIPSKIEFQKHIMEQKYGEDPLLYPKTAAEGALRGLTVGGSDVALAKAGITSPEAIEARKQLSPGVSTASELAGAVAPAFVGEEAGLAGNLLKYSPAGLIGKAGAAVSGAAAPAVRAGVEGLIGESSPLASRILTQAGASGLGSAVEGALYSGGSSISEDLLGDPSHIGEHLASALGMGALIGGGIGFGAGGVLGALSKDVGTMPKRASSFEAEDALKDIDANLQKIVEDSRNVGEKDVGGKYRPDYKNTVRTANEEGLPIFDSQVSSNPNVSKIESAQINGGLDGPALKKQAALGHAIDTGEQAIGGITKDAANLSEAELGKEIRTGFNDELTKTYKPISELYDFVKQSGKEISLSKGSLESGIEDLSNLDMVKNNPKGRAARIVKGIIRDLQDTPNVETMRSYISEKGRELPFELKYIMGEVKPIVDKIERDSALEVAKTIPGADEIITKHAAANKAYAKYKSDIEWLGSKIGKSRVRGHQNFLDYLNENITPENLGKKLFAKNDSEFMDFFAKRFPEQWDVVRRAKLGQMMADHAGPDGNLGLKGIKSFLKEVDGMSPELKHSMFDPVTVKRLENLHKYYQSLPTNINTSNTEVMSNIRNMFKNPLNWASGQVNGHIMDQYLKSTVYGKGATAKVLSFIENKSQGIISGIGKGVKDIVRGSAGLLDHAAGPLSKMMTHEDYQKDIKKIDSAMQNPEKMIELLNKSSGDLNDFAPNVNQAMTATLVRGMQYIKSIAPRPQKNSPMGMMIPPSQTEINKFYKSYNVVKNPLSILDEVKGGTLSAESMNALTTVYPDLTDRMRTTLGDEISRYAIKHDFNSMPYQRKLSISMFLNQDMTSSTEGQNIVYNQSTYAGPSQANQGMMKPTQKGLSSLSKNETIMTDMQKNAVRES